MTQKRIALFFLNFVLISAPASLLAGTAGIEISGDIKLTNGGALVFPDGSTQATATLQGPVGPIGLQGPQGISGLKGDSGAIEKFAYGRITGNGQNLDPGYPNNGIGSIEYINSPPGTVVRFVQGFFTNIPMCYVQTQDHDGVNSYNCSIKSDISLDVATVQCAYSTNGSSVISLGLAPNVTIACFQPSNPQQGSSNKTVFVTNQTFNGNLGGLSGADQKCQDAAAAAGLIGIYQAWLSSDTIAAKDRLTHHSGPYVRTDGAVVANNWTDLTDSFLKDPIICDEYRSCSYAFDDTVPDLYAFTNTKSNGASNGGSCSNWTTTGGSTYIGHPGSLTANWTYGYLRNCAGMNRLYCFQQ